MEAMATTCFQRGPHPWRATTGGLNFLFRRCSMGEHMGEC